MDKNCPNCQEEMKFYPICPNCKVIWLDGICTNETCEYIEGQIDPMLSGFWQIDYKSNFELPKLDTISPDDEWAQMIDSDLPDLDTISPTVEEDNSDTNRAIKEYNLLCDLGHWINMTQKVYLELAEFDAPVDFMDILEEKVKWVDKRLDELEEKCGNLWDCGELYKR